MKNKLLALIAMIMISIFASMLNAQLTLANGAPVDLTLTKTVTNVILDGSGKYDITYKYTVTNIGNLDPFYNKAIYAILITDTTSRGSAVGPIVITLPHSDITFGPYLDVNESATTYFTYIVDNPDEITDKMVTNNAVVTGWIRTDQWVQTTATASVQQPIPPVPELPAGALLGLGLLGIGGFILIRRRETLQVIKEAR